ncbi:response regulator [Aliiroseovarius crassostreae]|uniref:Sensory/regulatory protein RpfC n=1 Tax=Aliiroseovarius crassostreae TaxID=154981 RepID=A0A9Q9LTR5_9RHOB|nr:ATP-binding protein [Aliiroseovarius crassostreae]UWP95520.1 response regulator [Aliiroseovarius crassostreae]
MKIDDVLAQERRARMAAERLLAQKQAELSDANRKLSLHARNLSEEIVETREDLKETLTENSLVKADLERATEEIVIAKRRLWDSLETIEDGFAVFDQNECMIAANSAYLKPFDGLECIAPGISYVEILHAVLDEGIVDIGTMRPLAWRDMMLTRWRAPKLEPHTLRLWDGTYIKLVDRRSGDGDTVSLGLNITDTIQYEAKLKEARFKAEAANRAKSAFLANMSHEIRTPMNGVVAIAELLAEGELDEEQQLYVQTIKNSGEALLTIINDVLDYSKIEAAKLALKTEPFDLEAKLHDVVTLLMPSMQEKGLEISVDFDLFVPTLLTGDPVRIGQILTNLIGNAVKFTPEGHVQVRVLGGPVDGGAKQKIHITVEDSGIGIPAEMQSHIFGEFNQVEDERNRRFDGTGLGLAITKQLVELMHGEIWVESEEGSGSCFGLHMTLPVVQDVEIPNLPLGLTTATLLMDAGLHQTTLCKSLQAMGLEVHRITSPDALPSELNGHHVLFVQEEILARATPTMLHGLSSANVRVIQVNSQNHQAAAPMPPNCRIDRTLSMPILRQELFQTLQEIDFKSVSAESAAISNTQDTLEAVAELITAPQANPASPAPVTETEHSDGHGDDQPAQNDFPRPPEHVDLQHLPEAPLPRLQPQPEQTSSPIQNDQTASQDPSQSCPLPPAAAAQDLRQMRVLAAEDNRTNRLVFSKLVKPLDIDLKFANNGREALELFQSFQPDLVFMDISMPEMDGKQATRCIRELEAEQGLPHTRVVALTAHAMAGDAEEILRHGLDKHLTKPLKKPLIIGEIRDNCPINARPPLLED